MAHLKEQEQPNKRRRSPKRFGNSNISSVTTSEGVQFYLFLPMLHDATEDVKIRESLRRPLTLVRLFSLFQMSPYTFLYVHHIELQTTFASFRQFPYLRKIRDKNWRKSFVGRSTERTRTCKRLFERARIAEQT